MKLIAGVDEVGRGPLAGPVLACAVILHPQRPIDGLRDSKKLSAKKRDILCEIIKQQAFCWAIGEASVEEIDKLNILNAALLAMQRAIKNLKLVPDKVLVDGNKCPVLSMPVEAIVGGDDLIAEISAASIVAKVTRDQQMLHYDQLHPEYGFAQHKGYPTQGHLQALQKYGISKIHRLSFDPVKRLLPQMETL